MSTSSYLFQRCFFIISKRNEYTMKNKHAPLGPNCYSFSCFSLTQWRESTTPMPSKQKLIYQTFSTAWSPYRVVGTSQLHLMQHQLRVSKQCYILDLNSCSSTSFTVLSAPTGRLGWFCSFWSPLRYWRLCFLINPLISITSPFKGKHSASSGLQ